MCIIYYMYFKNKKWPNIYGGYLGYALTNEWIGQHCGLPVEALLNIYMYC